MTSPLLSPRPLHLLAYGTYLGSTFFQTFIGGTTAFRVLPRPQFAELQAAVFPVYFALQTACPVILALTFPPRTTPVVANAHATPSDSGLAALLLPGNRYGALLPLGTILVTSVLNLAWIGPATSTCKREMKHQETRDGKKSHDNGPQSKEMEALKKKFGMLHGVSNLLNLVGFVAGVAYAWAL